MAKNFNYRAFIRQSKLNKHRLVDLLKKADASKERLRLAELPSKEMAAIWDECRLSFPNRDLLLSETRKFFDFLAKREEDYAISRAKSVEAMVEAGKILSEEYPDATSEERTEFLQNHAKEVREKLFPVLGYKDYKSNPKL